MTKRLKVQLREPIHDPLEGTLGHVRSVVQAYVDKFGEEAKLIHDVEYDYDSESHYWYIEHFRLETDDEYNKRTETARKARERRKVVKAEQEKKERAELARLLAKYSEEK